MLLLLYFFCVCWSEVVRDIWKSLQYVHESNKCHKYRVGTVAAYPIDNWSWTLTKTAWFDSRLPLRQRFFLLFNRTDIVHTDWMQMAASNACQLPAIVLCLMRTSRLLSAWQKGLTASCRQLLRRIKQYQLQIQCRAPLCHSSSCLFYRLRKLT